MTKRKTEGRLVYFCVDPKGEWQARGGHWVHLFIKDEPALEFDGIWCNKHGFAGRLWPPDCKYLFGFVPKAGSCVKARVAVEVIDEPE